MAALLGFTFLVLAVFGRILLQYRKTGDHGIRFANPRTEPFAALAGAVFSLSFAISLVLIALDFLGTVPLASWDFAYAPLFAVPIGFLGIAIVLVAQHQMRSAWRIGVNRNEKTDLITHGLYAHSRNPIYFGIFVYWVGLAGTIPNPLIWSLGILCCGSIELIVRKVEEPYLRKVHGKAYADYLQCTNRYLIWRRE